MATPTVLHIPRRLQALAGLAVLLEKLERQPRQASADQYQRVATELRSLLEDSPDDPALGKLLEVFPATAELYENLRYAQAGLCLTRLEQAVPAEQQARAVMERLRHSH
jgi:hypothetical protein